MRLDRSGDVFGGALLRKKLYHSKISSKDIHQLGKKQELQGAGFFIEQFRIRLQPLMCQSYSHMLE
jgi:hypothetical protein